MTPNVTFFFSILLQLSLSLLHYEKYATSKTKKYQKGIYIYISIGSVAGLFTLLIEEKKGRIRKKSLLNIIMFFSCVKEFLIFYSQAPSVASPM